MVARVLDHNGPAGTLSFQVLGFEYVGCARCSGAVLGWAIGIATGLLGLTGPGTLWVTVLVAIPALVDWGTLRVGLRRGSLPARLLTGILLGWGVATFYTIACLWLLRPLGFAKK